MNYYGLFEGISGLGLAFKRAGATIQAVCEIDKTCQSVLRRHHPKAEVISDVKTINKNTFQSGAIDILAGGFPCQDLSVAGLRKGLAGERSGLWFEFLRIITDHKPRIVVIENVPGLLSGCGCFDCQVVARFIATHTRIRRRKGGQTCDVCFAGKRMLESHSGRNLTIVLQGLVKCGYGVCWRVFDSQYDGVAQRRNRVFIVASLGNAGCVEVLFERESGQWDSPPSREAGQGVAAAVTTGTGKSSGPKNGNGHPLNLITEPQPVGCRMMAFGEYVDDGTSSTLKQRDFKDATDLVIAPTLRSNGDAHSGFTTGDGLVIEPQTTLGQFGVRRLTPAECEALQGFPREWTAFSHDGKPISDSARYRRLGNAVCVPTAEWIARRITQQEAA